MNLTNMKCALEVARAGSISKASEILLMAPPNVSREIKELESELGADIFIRTPKGMTLTPEGQEFIGYAKNIISQVEDLKNIFTGKEKNAQRFSISVPRASYISEAFANFSQYITADSAEIFYYETNSSGTIKNILEADYKLGIVRYAEHHDKYFKNMFEEKGLTCEMIADFNYVLVMSQQNPLSKQPEIRFENLSPLIEIAHADPFVPSLPISSLKKEELTDNISKRIFVFERGSQFELLNKNPNTFMWVSPLPSETLERYHLVQRICVGKQKRYKDVLIYKNNYTLTELDRRFVSEIRKSKRKYLVY